MITSTANTVVKELVRLRSRRHRDATGQFIIEGARYVERAVMAGVTIVQHLVAPELGKHRIDAGVPITELAVEPFRKVSARQNPDGVIAVGLQLDTTLERLDPPAGGLLLVVESVEKPGNLGAILRTADGLGVDAVLVADPATDVHNPNVVQASQGALFAVALGVATSGQVVAWLDERGIGLVSLTPDGSTELREIDLTGDVALAIGAESVGLSPELLAAGATAAIPMKGSVDSLNASVTAAIALYEASRQRRQS